MTFMPLSVVVRLPEIKKYLNRDGLEEYNSLLPHSSTEMQTYVNEWLDEHPEATTTVQDGAITEPKLADKSVSLRTLADDTVHMLKGAILTGNLSGEVLTADDAYSAPPVSLTVDGKSTQDGTPTPEAPVEIVSLEQVNLGFYGRNLLDLSTLSNGYIGSDGSVYGSSNIYKHNDYLRAFPGVTYRVSQGGTAFNAIRTAFYDENKRFIAAVSQNNYVAPTFTAPANTAYMRSSFNGPYADKAMIEIDRGSYDGFVPYVGQSALIQLTQALRSLPDGTHDTLSFAYLRPSTREGWAWYTLTRTNRVAEMVLDGTRPVTRNAGTEIADGTWRFSVSYLAVSPVTTWSSTTAPVAAYCNLLRAAATASLYSGSTGAFGMYQGYFYVRVAGVATVAEMTAWLTDNPITVAYPISPTTTTLDHIELPILPAPDVTVWSDPSTGLTMEYVRDANIVIQNIEQAIADS